MSARTAEYSSGDKVKPSKNNLTAEPGDSPFGFQAVFQPPVAANAAAEATLPPMNSRLLSVFMTYCS
jgi:hypothetical protein